jgi:hypothetical protein
VARTRSALACCEGPLDLALRQPPGDHLTITGRHWHCPAIAIHSVIANHQSPSVNRRASIAERQSQAYLYLSLRSSGSTSVRRLRDLADAHNPARVVASLYLVAYSMFITALPCVVKGV